MSVEQGAITIPSDPHVRKEIKDWVLDTHDLMLQKEAFDAKIKDSVAGAAERFELPKEYLSKMAQMYHKSTFKKEQVKTEDIFSLYDVVMGDGDGN